MQNWFDSTKIYSHTRLSNIQVVFFLKVFNNIDKKKKSTSLIASPKKKYLTTLRCILKKNMSTTLRCTQKKKRNGSSFIRVLQICAPFFQGTYETVEQFSI